MNRYGRSALISASLADPSTGQSVSATAGNGCYISNHMCVFWNKHAIGNGSLYPKKYPQCKTNGRGWIFTGATTRNGFPFNTACSGNFYHEGDHGAPGQKGNCPGCTGYANNYYGIDWQITAGQPILAQYAGWITFSGTWEQDGGSGCSTTVNAGPLCGYGLAVVVQYMNGITAWYGHESKLKYKNVSTTKHLKRDYVAAGTVLGWVGKTGNVSSTTGSGPGPYADQVHLGWASPAVLQTTGTWVGAVGGASTSIKQTPLYTACPNQGKYQSVFLKLHAHWQVPSCLP